MGCIGSCCFSLILLVVVGALALALGLYFGLLNEDDIENLTGIETPTLPPFFFRDPYDGVSQADSPIWENGGSGGLTLKVVNACVDSWDERYNEAIQDWDGGSPDALTLSSEKVGRDIMCEFVEDIMVVCNDDYGEMGWKGINEIQFTADNRIVQSRAKMNDFYLTGASIEERQFVMCHEIGHGFGLAHTDEIFTNANLGDCMDYTNRFESNMRPGLKNYETLVDAYGEVSNRRLGASSGAPRNVTRIPDWLSAEYEFSSRSLLLSYSREDSIPLAEGEGWRVLHKSKHTAVFERDLGGGFGARVSMLLA